MEFATVAIALYVGHHVGDYWVQTDHQAATKGKAGFEGVASCTAHVLTYITTQAVCLGLAAVVTGQGWGWWQYAAALAVSAVTHYAADRREFGIMFYLARLLPMAAFLELGKPRDLHVEAERADSFDRDRVKLDNPTLGTGAWALDQSWHIFWSVFVPALILGA